MPANKFPACAIILLSIFSLHPSRFASAQCTPDLLRQSIPSGIHTANDNFGSAVATSGYLVAVGAPSNDFGALDAGMAHIYEYDTGAHVANLINPDPTAFDNFGAAVAISGGLAVVGAPLDDAGATDAGSAYVYATNGLPVATLANPAPASGDGFGVSVAISGNLAVVGAGADDAGAANAGTAYVFDATTGALIATLSNPAPVANDRFGASVAISNGIAVVGAFRDDAGGGDSGSAYVFDAATGTLMATLANPSPAASDLFGTSVAISENRVLVGAPQDDTGAADAGSAYVFNATTGALIATLNNPAPAASDNFGASVSIFGNTAVVGAYLADAGATDAGTAYIFDATTGAMTATLPNPSPTASDYYGSSVGISDNVVVVGAYRDDAVATDAGSIYTFTCVCTPDTLQQAIQNPIPATNDQFGFSVGVSGTIAVGGAPLADIGATDAGAAYVFETSFGLPLATLNNPTPATGDQFGTSVAISGNLAVVGAPADDAGAHFGGTAYVFSATTGALVTTLSKPVPAAFDLFGVAVAIDGNLAVVGAYHESTGATNAGSAYVFNATTGALVATLNNPAPASGDFFGGSVAISGNLVVVGADHDDAGATDAGTAYVFNATTGALVATLGNPAPTASDFFGGSVAISGNLAVVGAAWDDAGATDAGRAYVLNATTGALVATLSNPAPAVQEFFGGSVAISGNVVLASATGNDTGASGAGRVYAFDATTGALTATLDNPAPFASDLFGSSVRLSGDVAVIGAYLDNAGATDAGSVYTFTCNPPAPTPSPSASPTASPTTSPTDSATATPSPSETETPSPTASPTATPPDSPTPTPTDTATPAPTETASPSPTSSPITSPTASPSATPAGSTTPSPTLSPSPAPNAAGKWSLYE